MKRIMTRLSTIIAIALVLALLSSAAPAQAARDYCVWQSGRAQHIPGHRCGFRRQPVGSGIATNMCRGGLLM